MTWIKIDDGFPDHPKVLRLSDSAFRLHVSALCYSGRYLTDGLIPKEVVWRLGDEKAVFQLLTNALWIEIGNFYQIHDYLTYQSSKEQVEAEKQANRERVKKSQSRKTNAELMDYSALNNPFLMEPDTDTDIDTDTHNIKTSAEIAIAIPRVKSAAKAVVSIHSKLEQARKEGINAWNLTKLVEDEWDNLHSQDDVGGCIALTVWYVSELQSRKLNTSEIGRIGQMTKRFGRIALLAIDEAASKDLDDLVSYAFRVAQNLYAKKKVS